ncbi:unnamed protein product [Leptidea sinapis]|uniref:Uncharacterized protein n=1 Tax=Leptidea sinapis TaxID=189913 RepID=A0A5E4PUP2_9NEOP|nr:unnamed protein product [Leptidea sinapis]
MTEHWEHVTWEKSALTTLANASNTALQWLLDEKVVHVSISSIQKNENSMERLVVQGQVEGKRARGRSPTRWIDAITKATVSTIVQCTFLVPMNGGIWTMCLSLEEEEVSILSRIGMQNLSISCALVCLIVLGSAALVGAFGVCKHQISAVLVTGVLYLLAESSGCQTATVPWSTTPQMV